MVLSPVILLYHCFELTYTFLHKTYLHDTKSYPLTHIIFPLVSSHSYYHHLINSSCQNSAFTLSSFSAGYYFKDWITREIRPPHIEWPYYRMILPIQKNLSPSHIFNFSSLCSLCNLCCVDKHSLAPDSNLQPWAWEAGALAMSQKPWVLASVASSPLKVSGSEVYSLHTTLPAGYH